MNVRIQLVLLIAVLGILPAVIRGQNSDPGSIRASAAYAEVLLRRTELQADIEAFGESYTEANPRMVEMRAELASLDASSAKLFAIRPSETGRLTQALGKLMVKKAALEGDLTRLSRSYAKDHAEVKRARRRLETFDSAIAEILK